MSRLGMAKGLSHLALGLLGLMGVGSALIPLHSDLPVWAWSCGLLATWAAWAAMRLVGHAAQPVPPWPDTHAQLRRAVITWLALSLSALCLTAAVEAVHGQGFRAMRQEGKLTLTAILLLFWLRTGPTIMAAGSDPATRSRAFRRLAWGMRTALACGLGLALIAVVVLPRGALPVGPIPWATGVALAVAVMLPWAQAASRRSAWLNPWTVAAAAGVAAVLLSRSRAAWVILPWMVVAWAWGGRHRLRTLATGAAVCLVVLAGAVAYDRTQDPGIERGLRVLDLWTELQSWRAPSAESSIGSRQLLWAAAWDSIRAHPLVGIGPAAREALVQSVVPAAAQPDTPALQHVHQQFLNQAVDHGLPGLLAAVLSSLGFVALALRSPAGLLRRQLAGVAVVHLSGLCFNANLTHGPYVFILALSVVWIILPATFDRSTPDGQQSPHA